MILRSNLVGAQATGAVKGQVRSAGYEPASGKFRAAKRSEPPYFQYLTAFREMTDEEVRRGIELQPQ